MPSRDGANSSAPGLEVVRRRFSRRWWPIVGCLAGAITGVACRAEFDAERYLVFGWGQLTLRPQVEIGEVYDSNIFYQEQDEVNDFITVIRPGFLTQYGDETENFFSLRYVLDASFYADRNDLNNLGHLLSHSSRYRFSRLTVNGDDRLSITDSLLGGTFSYIEKRVGQLSLVDNWRADYEVSPKTLVGIKAVFDLVDYDAEDLAPYHLYDSQSYSGGVRVGYLPSEKITVFPEFSFGQSFLSGNIASVPDAPALNSYSFSLGAEGDFTPKLTGLVSGGYEMRNYEDDTEVPNGWIASLQLRWQVRAKTALSVGYRHWVQVSREAVGYTYTAQRPTISVVQELGTQGRWTVNLDAYYQFDVYDRTVLVDGEEVDRTDDLAGVTLRAGFRWKPWLLASAGYDFLTFSDNIPTIQDYDVHRFSLRLVAGY